MDYEHTCAVLTRGPKSGNQSRNESRMMLLSVVRSVILVAVPVARHEPRVTQWVARFSSRMLETKWFLRQMRKWILFGR